MDDLTVTTPLVPGGQWILQGLEKLIKKWWGKVVEKFHFQVDGIEFHP